MYGYGGSLRTGNRTGLSLTELRLPPQRGPSSGAGGQTVQERGKLLEVRQHLICSPPTSNSPCSWRPPAFEPVPLSFGAIAAAYMYIMGLSGLAQDNLGQLGDGDMSAATQNGSNGSPNPFFSGFRSPAFSAVFNGYGRIVRVGSCQPGKARTHQQLHSGACGWVCSGVRTQQRFRFLER